ncbi:hypothetical protein JKP88DRAFT_243247 [Tribonema minus]|uniref:Uncharacterized protein n=1 Tax=Tribonema minus TaxID=303371 RepID=A0A836CKM5_9STRA|nr:hypothetical protein JKP88DRAFT_243247 [Tribonema minus]
MPLPHTSDAVLRRPSTSPLLQVRDRRTTADALAAASRRSSIVNEPHARDSLMSSVGASPQPPRVSVSTNSARLNAPHPLLRGSTCPAGLLSDSSAKQRRPSTVHGSHLQDNSTTSLNPVPGGRASMVRSSTISNDLMGGLSDKQQLQQLQQRRPSTVHGASAYTRLLQQRDSFNGFAAARESLGAARDGLHARVSFNCRADANFNIGDQHQADALSHHDAPKTRFVGGSQFTSVPRGGRGGACAECAALREGLKRARADNKRLRALVQQLEHPMLPQQQQQQGAGGCVGVRDAFVALEEAAVPQEPEAELTPPLREEVLQLRCELTELHAAQHDLRQEVRDARTALAAADAAQQAMAAELEQQRSAARSTEAGLRAELEKALQNTMELEELAVTSAVRGSTEFANRAEQYDAQIAALCSALRAAEAACTAGTCGDAQLGGSPSPSSRSARREDQACGLEGEEKSRALQLQLAALDGHSFTMPAIMLPVQEHQMELAGVWRELHRVESEAERVRTEAQNGCEILKLEMAELKGKLQGEREGERRSLQLAADASKRVHERAMHSCEQALEMALKDSIRLCVLWVQMVPDIVECKTFVLATSGRSTVRYTISDALAMTDDVLVTIIVIFTMDAEHGDHISSHQHDIRTFVEDEVLPKFTRLLLRPGQARHSAGAVPLALSPWFLDNGLEYEEGDAAPFNGPPDFDALLVLWVPSNCLPRPWDSPKLPSEYLSRFIVCGDETMIWYGKLLDVAYTKHAMLDRLD